MLTLLAAAARCVDAVSLLGLGQVLTAAMTGNMILLGLALGQAQLAAALRSMVALLGFFAGVVLGASIVRPSRIGAIWSPAVLAALAIELALLVALAAVWQFADETQQWMEQRLPLIAAVGLAMGIQSAIVRRIGSPSIATTYVTGTLTGFATRLVSWLHRRAPDEDHKGDASIWLLAGVWAAYGGGAAFAGATRHWWPSVALWWSAICIMGEVQWPSAALLVPIAILASVTVLVGGK